MSTADDFRRKADDLLAQASCVENMNERGKLIDEALQWHNLAMDAHGRHERLNDNDAWEALDDLDDQPRQA